MSSKENGSGAPKKRSRKDYASDQEVRWCPGCGDYAILAGVQKSLADLGVDTENTVFVSGIGCSSRFPYYMNTYGFHGIHGRAPAIASGVKLAQPDLSVWVITGDGDGLSIGGNHLLHALRRNIDLKIILFNNQIYGLTKGQYSPTSQLKTRSPSTPMGSIDFPVNPVAFAIGAGASFIARCIDTDAANLTKVLERAAHHTGGAFIEILQNCPVFNDEVWGDVADKKQSKQRRIYLQDGEPMVTGDGKTGIRFRPDLTPEQVVVGDGDGEVPLSQVAVHRESGPIGHASLLAEMTYPAFPIPLGVLRVDERPSYEQQAAAQVKASIERKGPGDLHQLLHSGMMWTVDEDGNAVE